MAIPGSNEWLQIFINAREIAGQLEQNLSSVHVVLAIFLIPNKAEELLLERGVNEDRILEQGRILVEEQVDTIYVWAYLGQVGTTESCEDPELAWSKACEVLRMAKNG